MATLVPYIVKEFVYYIEKINLYIANLVLYIVTVKYNNGFRLY
jgi:hypothetical protein